MNTIYSSINQVTVFLNNYFATTLTAQQKKIVAIAAATFCSLAACYIFIRCCLTTKKFSQKNEAIQDQVLSKRGKKTYTDPYLKKYEQLSPNLIIELATQIKEKYPAPLSTICNTGMTELLVQYTFIDRPLPLQDLNDFLKSLADEAVTHRNHHAKLALTLPNNSTQSTVDFEHSFDGFPQNTPLAFLVKGMNLEGCQHILPVYEKTDLLFTTPRGNTVLHLAIMTGQFAIAIAIMKRAQELEILDELLNKQNTVQKTADEMLTAIINSKDFFKIFLDLTDRYFGGEEINKALIGRETPQIHSCRNRLIQQIRQVLNKNFASKDLQNRNLKAMFEYSQTQGKKNII